MSKITKISDVVEHHLCVGCGACANLYPESITMYDDIETGIRPYILESSMSMDNHRDCLFVCPGWHLNAIPSTKGLGDQQFKKNWGTVLEVWEGYASDEGVRFSASSGGVISALALFCLEKAKMSGVVHVNMDEKQPYRNKTVFSTTREQVLQGSGSRYAPSSPCENLTLIGQQDKPALFIGKPCDIAAVKSTMELIPSLNDKIGMTIGIFCAGVPSTRGTLDLLKKVGVNELDEVKGLRYRGNGWPGLWQAKRTNEADEQPQTLSYEESWGFLQRYRQWRCYICPDHSGEFADIAIGDPWYKKIDLDDPGQSLVVVRTERGQKLLNDALAAGYIQLKKIDLDKLSKSQPNLLKTKAGLWGRLFTLNLFRVVAPEYKQFSLFELWFFELNLKEKISSLLGTAKRIWKKKLFKKYQILNKL